jgi:uncharacterized protein
MERREFLKTVATGTLGATLGMSLPDQGKAMEPHTKGTGKGTNGGFLMVDAYTHFSTMGYVELLEKLSGQYPNPFRILFERNQPLIDEAQRIQSMDRIGANMHVLIPTPYLEGSPSLHADRPKALQAARYINNALAGVVERHPERFRGVAMLPTFNAEDMVAEFERAVRELHMVGGSFVVSPAAKPPDHPDYFRLYEKACDLDVPLWIHPARGAGPGDYPGEPMSKYNVWMTIGWPMDTSIAMNRIVFSGVFKTYPKVKLIVHHRGALIPFWFNRINEIVVHQPEMAVNISPPYITHFQKFYTDTACNGVEPEQMSMCYKFFGPDHTLFGTDSPLDGQGGSTFYRNARESLGSIGLSSEILTKIFSSNILSIISRP